MTEIELRRGQTLKFVRHDDGFVRTYYRGQDDGHLYCFQPTSHGSEWPPRYEFLTCTRDGEPSYTVATPIKSRCVPFHLPPWGRKPASDQ